MRRRRSKQAPLPDVAALLSRCGNVDYCVVGGLLRAGNVRVDAFLDDLQHNMRKIGLQARWRGNKKRTTPASPDHQIRDRGTRSPDHPSAAAGANRTPVQISRAACRHSKRTTWLPSMQQRAARGRGLLIKGSPPLPQGLVPRERNRNVGRSSSR